MSHTGEKVEVHRLRRGEAVGKSIDEDGPDREQKRAQAEAEAERGSPWTSWSTIARPGRKRIDGGNGDRETEGREPVVS